ncbi:hypothetical protein M0812_06541 [Anaeramoeba flamelloides]|uniref:Saposin B-type domain-containing protein n=1 Tax=Anaeramoeba flamelloides TaxID=1746091 RepID=A0AAV8AAE9_9EUKA|nr:hypothetical protein M0812_06541 [Anaeramoeba flamelloides]
MKKQLIVIAFIALIVGAQCGELSVSKKNRWCSPCCTFMSESLNTLLNIILNGGVVGGCGDLCSRIPGSKTVQELCFILCDLVGFEIFVHLVEKADLDPIWMCEKVTVCSHAMGNGKLLSVKIIPESGPVGTKFEIEVVFQIDTKIGTGELDVAVFGGANMPIGDGELLVDLEPNEYGLKFTFTTQESEKTPWLPGKYEVALSLCDGECGSKHEWSKTLSKKKSYFNISK